MQCPINLPKTDGICPEWSFTASQGGTLSSARSRTEVKATEVPSAPRKCVLLGHVIWKVLVQIQSKWRRCPSGLYRSAWQTRVASWAWLPTTGGSSRTLLRRKGTPLCCDRVFCELKRCLLKAPVLAYPKFDLEFILDTNAINTGIGAVLSKVQDGQQKVTTFASRTMSKVERNYTVTKREMLTLVYFMRYFRHYLYGWKFTVRTDHGALQWLASSKEPSGQVVRWLEQLAEFTYNVQHRPGKKHGNADALSRKAQVRGGTEEKVPTVSAVSCSSTGCFPEQ